jgi:cobalamin biosynthesis Mg chelatase CobN
MKKAIYIIVLAMLLSCGARKSQVSKSETKQKVKTELTDKGTIEKTQDAQVTTRQQTTLKEDENVLTEETQTDYNAIDLAKPIIEVNGKDTTKIYNANKTVKTKKTTANRQTEANATTNTTKQEKAQERHINDLTIKQEAKAAETKKEKVTDKEASMAWLPISLMLVVWLILLIAWLRRKKKE